jgi:predicted RNA-binding Zn ribbon-like protein
MPSISESGRVSRPEFLFLGDHPAVDFANTLVPPPGPDIDFLRTWQDAIDWFVQAKLTSAASLHVPEGRATEALKALVALRQAWRSVLAQIIAGGKVSDEFLEKLNALLGADAFTETLQRSGKKGFQLVRSASQHQGEKLALAVLAHQIAHFLVKANLNLLHQCANTTSCVLYFYDTTKNHRRQWCSVATCGNRHKVAEFRRRQALSQRKTALSTAHPTIAE